MVRADPARFRLAESVGPQFSKFSVDRGLVRGKFFSRAGRAGTVPFGVKGDSAESTSVRLRCGSARKAWSLAFSSPGFNLRTTKIYSIPSFEPEKMTRKPHRSS